MSVLLPAFARAFNEAGKSKAKIAREVGNTTETLRSWFYGERLVPEHKRAALDRALGVPVDWVQACADYRKKKDQPDYPQRPPQAPAKAAAPAPAPRPIQEPEKAATPAKRMLFGIIPIIDDMKGAEA